MPAAAEVRTVTVGPQRLRVAVRPGRPNEAGHPPRPPLLLINGISLSADQNGFPHMKAAIAATAYLLPPAEGTFNGATPTGPAGGSAGGQPTSASGSPAAPPAPAVVKP